MSKATGAQKAKIHVLLGQQNLLIRKAQIVASFSNGRTESTKELSMEEAKALIQWLVKNDPDEKMRSKVFALAYEAGIIYGNTSADKAINSVKLNEFLHKRGTVKKDLSKMNHEELIKTVSQFTKMTQHVKEATDKKAADNIVLNVLSEINEAFTNDGQPYFRLPVKWRSKQL